MISYGVQISITGEAGGIVRSPSPRRFFLFLLYHAFIVFRYKKLRAVLAMEKTNPIYQNKKQKKSKILSSPWSAV